MGYDTVLAEGGSNLSGGQRQLVALTAILSSDRPYLFLDEATANLDQPTIRRIEKALKESKRTCVIAAHT